MPLIGMIFTWLIFDPNISWLVVIIAYLFFIFLCA